MSSVIDERACDSERYAAIVFIAAAAALLPPYAETYAAVYAASSCRHGYCHDAATPLYRAATRLLSPLRR